MSITTLSTIRPGPAEKSEWMLYDMGAGEYALCRIVLKLQRFTLIEVEDLGLCWIFTDDGKYLIPTEPADDRGISPVAKAAEAIRIRESLQEAMLETVHRSAALGLLEEPPACHVSRETHSYVDYSRPDLPVVSFTIDVPPAAMEAIRGMYGVPAGIFNPHDLEGDPGTPPDLR